MIKTLNKEILASIVPALVLSLTTIWLIETPLKYGLYLLEVLLILLLYFTLSGRLKSKLIFEGKIFLLDGLLLAVSALQSALVSLGSSANLNLVPAIITAYFLPGYFVLRLSRFRYLHSSMEWPVMAFSLSLGLTPLMFLITLPFAERRAAIMSFIYLLMSIYLILRDAAAKSHQKSGTRIEISYSEALGLLWITLLFTFVILSLFPQRGLITGFDNAAHISASRLVAYAPDFYSSYYPFYHLSWAAVYELSTPLLGAFQTGLAYLNIMLIFSFYIMVRAYFRDAPMPSPLIATLFFSSFAGLGWLKFLGAKLSTPAPSLQLDMLMASSDVSYWDTEVAQSFWLWSQLRPLTIGFALFFALLYLLYRKDLPRRTFIPILSFLLITLFLNHLTEFLVFNLFFFAVAFFASKMPYLRLKDAAGALIIGNLAYIFATWPSPAEGGFFVSPLGSISIVLTVVAAVSYAMTHRPLWPSKALTLINPLMKHWKFLFCAVSAASAAAILTWALSLNIFKYDRSYTQYVPMVMYPVLLGIVGLLAIYGFTIVAKDHAWSPSAIFILLFIVTFGISKLSLLIMPRYGERRWILMLFASVCVLASPALTRVWAKLTHQKRMVVPMAVLSLTVAAGVTSTFLAVDQWKLIGDADVLSQDEIDVVDYLSSPAIRDVRTPIWTALPRTRALARFAPTPRLPETTVLPLWSSRSPEIPQLLLRNERYPPPYLLLTPGDREYILYRFAEGYMATHVLPSLTPVYADPIGLEEGYREYGRLELVKAPYNITVLRVPGGSPPHIDSNVLLVLPEEGLEDTLLVYDVLSYGNYEYSPTLRSDTGIIKGGEIIILPKDDDDLLELIDNLILAGKTRQMDKKIIIFNTNGYGPISELFFDAGLGDTSSGGVGNTSIGYDLRNWTRPPSSAVVETELGTGRVWNSWPGAYSPPIEVNPGSELLVKMKVRQEGVRDPSPSSVIVYAGEQRLSGWALPVGTFGWMEMAEVIAVPPGVRELRIQLNGGSGAAGAPSKTWFDDLRIYQDGRLIYGNNFDVSEGGVVRATRMIGRRDTVELLAGVGARLWTVRDGVRVLAWYSDGERETPLAAELSKGGVTLIYTNVYPFTRRGSSLAELWSLIGEFGRAIEVAGLDLPAHKKGGRYVFEGDAAFFRGALLEGRVAIEAPSFTDFSVERQALMRIVGDEQVTASAVGSLHIEGVRDARIDAPKAEIRGGKGFYTSLAIVDPVLRLSEDAIISWVTPEGKNQEIRVKGGNITITGEVTVLARSPYVNVEGVAELREMYSLSSLYDKLWSNGEGWNIRGSIGFRVPVSDVYSFATEFSWKGTTARYPPIITWNEYDSLRGMLPIFTPLAVAIWYVFLSERKLTRNKPNIPITDRVSKPDSHLSQTINYEYRELEF